MLLCIAMMLGRLTLKCTDFGVSEWRTVSTSVKCPCQIIADTYQNGMFVLYSMADITKRFEITIGL